MNKVFSDDSWADYLYWQTQDKKTLKRINALLQDIERNGHHGIGNPELLKGLAGYRAGIACTTSATISAAACGRPRARAFCAMRARRGASASSVSIL